MDEEGVVKVTEVNQEEVGVSSDRAEQNSREKEGLCAREAELYITPNGKGNGGISAEKFLEHFTTALEEIVQKSVGKKERKGKECGLGSVSAHAVGKKVSEGSLKGERKEFKNTMEWVRKVEELMKKDKILDQKVDEALKEVNKYLWTVYDKEKEEYVEEGRNRAMKAATIFLVKNLSLGRDIGFVRGLENGGAVGMQKRHSAVLSELD
nr:hypothetical protein Iba_chr03aCG21260 [Ipomoea batatas]